jgi:hypothetical protein
MSSVFFDPEIGGDGSTVSDDADPNTGLRNYGWTTRFIPALAQLVAVATWTQDWVAARKNEIEMADGTAQEAAITASGAAATASQAAASAGASAQTASSAAEVATQMRNEAATIRDQTQEIATGEVIDDGEIVLVKTWSSVKLADELGLATDASFTYTDGVLTGVVEQLPGGRRESVLEYSEGALTAVTVTLAGRARRTTYTYTAGALTGISVDDIFSNENEV